MVRREAQFWRLAAFVFLLAILAVPFFAGRWFRSSGATREAQALAAVMQYAGKDLGEQKPEELEPLLDALERLTPLRPKQREYLAFFAPRYVWEFGTGRTKPGCLLLESERFVIHPGATGISLTAIDHSGTLRARADFTTGWRCYLHQAHLETLVGFNEPVVVLETTNGPGPGPGVARQYYARIGGGFHLVRIEKGEDIPDRNAYYINHFRSGPRPPHQTPEEWETDLTSKDRARILRALVWLGGHHHLPRPPGKLADSQEESEEDAELVRRVRARPGVVARLKELSERGDEWEWAQAWYALNPEDWEW